MDHHLDICERLGQSPDKPYSGRVLLHVSPDTHAAIASAAELAGKNLNRQTAEVLESAAH